MEIEVKTQCTVVYVTVLMIKAFWGPKSEKRAGKWRTLRNLNIRK
jgi:hypothetical protein